MTEGPCARDDGVMADTTADRPDPRLSERDRPWMMRTYSGHSTAEASNALYRTNLSKGQTGLSIAFDLPTQCGYDPDDARARGVDVHLDLVGVLADRDVREARMGELADDVTADRDVLGEVVSEQLLVEPVALPVVDVPHAHGLGMDLLPHLSSPSR